MLTPGNNLMDSRMLLRDWEAPRLTPSSTLYLWASALSITVAQVKGTGRSPKGGLPCPNHVANLG